MAGERSSPNRNRLDVAFRPLIRFRAAASSRHGVVMDVLQRIQGESDIRSEQMH
jgi:hypothetical protein